MKRRANLPTAFVESEGDWNSAIRCVYITVPHVLPLFLPTVNLVVRMSPFGWPIKRIHICGVWCCLVLSICLGTQQVYAQTSPLKFERMGIEQGLINSTIYAILQDQTGYLWLATEGGLVKYDGYAFHTFQYDPNDPQSLSTNLVTSLYEDRDGYLWVGTNQGGINRFDPATERFTRFSVPHQESWVSSFGEDSTGVLYACTLKRPDPFLLFDTERQRFEAAPLALDFIPDPEATFFVDANGHWWARTPQDGLYRLNPQTQGVDHFFPRLFQENSAKENLSFGGEGDLWLRVKNGQLLRFRPQTGAVDAYPALPHDEALPSISSVLMDSRGLLWIGAAYEGLVVYDPLREQRQRYTYQPHNPYSLSGKHVKTMFEDRSGIVWLGTLQSGLNKVLPRQRHFQHIYHNPDGEGGVMRGLVMGFGERTNGDVLIATSEGSLQAWSPASQTFTAIEVPNDGVRPSLIKAIHEDATGALWLGGWGSGLWRWDRSGQITHYKNQPDQDGSISSNAMRVIHEDQQGTLWIGTEEGLAIYDAETDRFRTLRHEPENPHSLGSNTVWALLEDQQGRFWVGTYAGGLNLLDRETGHVQRFQHDPYDSQSLSSNNVASLHEDAEGQLWVGTHGGGLNRFEPDTGRFERFTAREGLPDNHIHGILEDDAGHLWMSTNDGIVRFDPRTASVKAYTPNDGVQGKAFSVGSFLKRSDGAFLFGGSNGFNVFFPDSIRVNHQPPPVALSSFLVNEETVALDALLAEAGGVEIPYEGNAFSFETVALDFTAPEQNQYAHKLEGFDGEWVHTGTRRFVSYTNLDPGPYTLHVKGANSDGVWNETGVRVPIYIVPPIWMRGWFRALVVLGLLLGVSATVRFVSTRALRRRVQALEVEQQLQQERERISRDLHDHVGAQLTYIISSLDLHARRAQSREPEREALKALGGQARSTMQQLRQTIWALRHEAISVGAFVDQVRRYVQQQVKHLPEPKAQFQQVGDQTYELTPTQALNLFRIVQEAVTNVLKHADAQTLAIHVVHNEQVIHLYIQDDGSGFAPDKPQTDGCGLANMTYRAKAIGAAIDIVSTPGEGTTIDVRLPI